MADQDYVIQPVQPGDTEECLELLRKTFFIDEPMNHAVGLCSDGNCADLEEYSAHYLHENGWSFKAVDKNGKIVGVMVSGLSPLKPKDDGSDYVTQAQQCKDPKFAKILYVLAQREEGAKLWEKFPDLDEVLDVKLAATDPNWRKRGIMNNLLAATEKLAKERGIKVLRMDTSSAFSAMSAEKLGFTCMYYAPYTEIKMDGKPLIVPEPPHIHDKVYTKVLL